MVAVLLSSKRFFHQIIYLCEIITGFLPDLKVMIYRNIHPIAPELP